MFEMLLSQSRGGNIIPYLGEIGLTGIGIVPGLTTTELYLAGGGTVAETAGQGLFLWDGKNDKYTNLGTLPSGMHPNRISLARGLIDNKLYFIHSNAIYCYDILKPNWTTLPAAPLGTEYSFYGNGSVTYNGSLYFFGPNTNASVVAIKKYNHLNNTWSTEAYMPNAPSGKIYTTGVMVGDVAYFFGGSSRVTKYNFTTKTFSEVALSAIIFSAPCVALYNGKIIITPMDEPGQPTYSSTGKLIMVYDPATDTITQVAETNPPKLTGAAVIVGNIFKAYGGQNTTTNKPEPGVQSIVVGPPVDSSEPIDILSTTQITRTDQPIRQLISSADEQTNRIWIHRGVLSGGQWNTWLGYYDVATGAWTPRYNWASSPPLAGSMTVLDNQVYYFINNSVWVFNNNTGVLTTKTAPGGAVFAPYSVPAFTYKGNVYQMGTVYVSGVPYCQVVRYNPTDNTRTLIWSVSGVLDHSSASGVLVGDWYCICGSNNSNGVAQQVYCFNMVTGVFKNISLRAGLAIDGNPPLVSNGKTFSILGGNIWTVDPNTGYSWQSGRMTPLKLRGASIINNDVVTYYGGSTSSTTVNSPSILTFKYPVS